MKMECRSMLSIENRKLINLTRDSFYAHILERSNRIQKSRGQGKDSIMGDFSLNGFDSFKELEMMMD